MTHRPPRPRPNRREMRLEELRLLSQMLALTSSDSSVQAVLQNASQNAARLTSATRASIAVPLDTGRLRFAAEWDGSDPRPLLVGCEITSSEGTLVAGAMASRDPVHVPGEELLKQMSPHGPAQASRFRMRMVLLVPMVANERVEGLLTVSRPRRKQKFSKHDMTLAVAIADHAALAIQGARAIERERRERLRERLLSRVVVLGLRPGNSQDVAREAIGLIRDAMGGSCVMAFLPGAGNTVAHVVGEGDVDPGPAALARAAKGMAMNSVPLVGAAAGLDGPMVIAAEPAHVADSLLPAGAEELRRAWRDTNVRSWAAVALRPVPDSTGLLAVGRRDAQGFQRADLDFFRTAAETMSLAMRGAAELLAR